jgi:Flp pilus assembly protein TadB
MTAKQTALINVTKLVGLALIVGIVTTVLLMHVPLPYVAIGVCVAVMLYLIHMIYELELSKAEYRETLTQLKKDLEG